MTHNGCACAPPTLEPATAQPPVHPQLLPRRPCRAWGGCPRQPPGRERRPVPGAWLARRDRQETLGRDSNGISTSLAIAIELRPTPAEDCAAEPGEQWPSRAGRQPGLPEVITHHLARLHRDRFRHFPQVRFNLPGNGHRHGTPRD
jgi:hypothetical protein